MGVAADSLLGAQRGARLEALGRALEHVRHARVLARLNHLRLKCAAPLPARHRSAWAEGSDGSAAPGAFGGAPTLNCIWRRSETSARRRRASVLLPPALRCPGSSPASISSVSMRTTPLWRCASDQSCGAARQGQQQGKRGARPEPHAERREFDRVSHARPEVALLGSDVVDLCEQLFHER